VPRGESAQVVEDAGREHVPPEEHQIGRGVPDPGLLDGAAHRDQPGRFGAVRLDEPIAVRHLRPDPLDGDDGRPSKAATIRSVNDAGV
jgi:hypothetical protein